jgi:ApbE superfamily uncharacterized protein (UPF0280 family)
MATLPPSRDKHLYQPRNYRFLIQHLGLKSFRVQVMETDLFILAEDDLSDIALNSVYKYRKQIEEYIYLRPEFRHSLVPIAPDPPAPPIIRGMLEKSQKVSVGPMAAVAGAVAQFVADDLLHYSDEIIVENGGDIYLKTKDDLRVPVYAGSSRLSMKIALKVKAKDTPLGICTSSGTIGHSISFGRADAVCVISKSAILADAAATAVGNLVTSAKDIKPAVEFGMNLPEVLGILIIVEDKMGAGGRIELA